MARISVTSMASEKSRSAVRQQRPGHSLVLIFDKYFTSSLWIAVSAFLGRRPHRWICSDGECQSPGRMATTGATTRTSITIGERGRRGVAGEFGGEITY